MPWLTLSASNYPCLEQISMVPNMFEPLRFDCSKWNQKIKREEFDKLGGLHHWLKCYFLSPEKKANVTPVYKKDDEYLPKNKRPVSFLSPIGKTMKHCVYKRLYNYIVEWPRWLSWMRRPTGDQEVAGSTPAEVGNILSWRLIMKYFLRSFSPFRWFKKRNCQFLAKECAHYWLTA